MLVVEGVPPLGGVKQWWGGENKLFCSWMCQYLESRRYVKSYYLWLIGSCICAFDWHQDRWPWITLNSISLNFQRISWDFADFGRNNEDRPVLSATTL